jgi:exosortase
MARHGRPWSAQEYGILALVVGLAFWLVRAELGDIWRVTQKDIEQSHILLVPVVAAWLLYLRRGRLALLRYRPSFVGLGLILLAWAMIWLGHETDVLILRHVGGLALILGAVLSVFGTLVIRLFLPVVVVFVFAIPVHGTVRQIITMPLQKMAATVTHLMLDLVGISSEQIGNALIVNGANVAVGEACNGMRMVFALTLVVYAFVFSVPLRVSTKRLLLILSPFIALLCNVVRLVPTALVYGYGSATTAEQFHDLAGWVMLPIALGLMAMVLRLLDWMELPVRQWRLAQ